jgi:hypothetical protein
VKRKGRVSALPFFFLVTLMLAGCGTTQTSAATDRADDAAIAADFVNHRSNVEVTADGVVVGTFPDRKSSDGTHEQFIIRLTSQNLTVEIEHNISIGRRVPVAQGDEVVVHGEYIWNAQGGLIHFTHHDPQGTHENGYITDKGQTYD